MSPAILVSCIIALVLIVAQIIILCLKLEKKYLSIAPIINALILIGILAVPYFSGDKNSAFNFSVDSETLKQIIILFISMIVTGITFASKNDQSFVEGAKDKKKKADNKKRRQSRIYDPEGEEILNELRELKKTSQNGEKK